MRISDYFRKFCGGEVSIRLDKALGLLDRTAEATRKTRLAFYYGNPIPHKQLLNRRTTLVDSDSYIKVTFFVRMPYERACHCF
ncbi:hypothetical protein Ciccas_007946 [Cichlidogyrus casuarinus]|uniref:Uncharacterized protein n=1 Tax=Cichlidogyrus casuarinus TaxID=1844966 RepID=A0ABD2Q2S5_9PLAT